MTGLFSGMKAADLMLAAFTVMLVFIGHRQANISEGQREIMDRQTDIAEQGMTISKQPRIFVSDIRFYSWMDRVPVGGSPEQYKADPSASYCLNIAGETPATTRLICQDLLFEKTIPKDLPPVIGVVSTSHHTLRPGDAPVSLEAPFLDITDKIKMQIRGYDGKGGFLPLSERSQWFLIGLIVYDDVFGNQHELRFCYTAPSGGGQGYIYGGRTRR